MTDSPTVRNLAKARNLGRKLAEHAPHFATETRLDGANVVLAVEFDDLTIERFYYPVTMGAWELYGQARGDLARASNRDLRRYLDSVGGYSEPVRPCNVVRPNTLGYQSCSRAEGHTVGRHRSQDGRTYAV